MEIKDKLFVDEGVFIRSKPISGLIAALNSKGIKINPKDCEQDIEYRILMTLKKATIPLELQLGRCESVVAYTLRNEELEMTLRDHQPYSRGMPGAIGGSHPIGSPGVLCNFKFSGSNEGARIIETAQDVLREFYS